MIRTKLQYKCEKYEDFNGEWFTQYDRSYDMIVTTSTKELCEKAMYSFEQEIRNNDIQDSFESNLEPEYDENKNVWVGVVEVYIDNQEVSEQKEEIKEVYKEWKETIKNIQVVEEVNEDTIIENKQELKTVKRFIIKQRTLDDMIADNKFLGKGSRKFREEIEEQLIDFIDLEAEFASERYNELTDWESEDEMIEQITITNPMILKEVKIIKDRIWGFEKTVFPASEGFEVNIEVYCNSILQTVDSYIADRVELKKLIKDTGGTVKLANDCLF